MDKVTLNYDPRNPRGDCLVNCGSTNSIHRDLRKTLVLLSIAIATKGDIYFVIEGLHSWPATYEELCSDARYYYEEHTCPTNFIRIPMICRNGDTDPHGVFKFVDAVWMTCEYEAYNDDNERSGISFGEVEAYLCTVFPQLG